MSTNRRLEATLDPISIFLIFVAFSTLGLLQTLTQNVVYPGLQLYVNVGGLSLIFALVLLVAQGTTKGSPLIGPITRPNDIYNLKKYLGEKYARYIAPIIALSTGWALIVGVNYFFTQFTFLPTVTFWTALTPKLFFGSGGIIETIPFDLIPLLLFLLFVPRFVEDPRFYFGVTLPIMCAVAVTYHLFAYPNSAKAFSIVFGEFASFGYAYRATALLLWVAMVLHSFTDVVGSP